MRKQSRFIGPLLLALGVALVVGGLAAPRFLLGDARLPLNLQHTTWTIADPGGVRDGKPAPVVRQLHMEIRNPSGADRVSVRVGDSLRAGDLGSDFDNLVSASTWAFSMDRVSGEVADPADVQLVMAMPATQVPIQGAWLKFPSDVERRDYDVFDPTLRTALPASFVGEETVAGRTVYVFRQEVGPTNVAKLYADPLNTAMVADAEGNEQRAFRFHAATRELRVDQGTGLVVGINERVDDYYADAAGRGLRNIVTYDGVMDGADVEANVGQLTRVVSQSLSRKVTLACIGLGALLALAGLAAFARRHRR